MAAAPDFNIIKPELAGSFGAGYRASQENRMSTEQNQIQLEQLKSDRESMIQLQNQLKAAGKNPDLDQVFDALIATGKPDYVVKGIDGKKRLEAQREYAKANGLDMPGITPAAPAAGGAPMLGAAPDGAPMAPPSVVRLPQPAAPVNALGSGTYGMNVPGMMPGAPAAGNALRGSRPMGAPGAAAPVNAMAAGPDEALVNQTRTRINNLLQFASKYAGTPEGNQAVQQAKIMQDQLELYSKRAPNIPAALQELEAYMAMSPEQKAAFEKLQKIKATNVTTTATSSPTGKSLSEPVGKRVDASLAKAEGAAGLMENANMIQEALNSGKVIAGPMAGPRTTIAQLLNMAGADNQAQLQNSLSVAKGLAGLTLESRGELKGQGQVTDTETKLLERARSGDTTLTLDELQQVVNVSQRLARRLWGNHENLLKTMEKDPAAKDSIEYYRPSGRLPEPVPSNKPATPADATKRKQGLDSIFKK
tara:strand:+ start:2349 stop:3779 length:1431 start_codon:yes stop_codon:yes gene_type:complete